MTEVEKLKETIDHLKENIDTLKLRLENALTYIEYCLYIDPNIEIFEKSKIQNSIDIENKNT